jgi:hypothetical protein
LTIYDEVDLIQLFIFEVCRDTKKENAIMKLTTAQLRKIIKEEVTRMLREEEASEVTPEEAIQAAKVAIADDPSIVPDADPEQIIAALKQIAKNGLPSSLTEVSGAEADKAKHRLIKKSYEPEQVPSDIDPEEDYTGAFGVGGVGGIGLSVVVGQMLMDIAIKGSLAAASASAAAAAPGIAAGLLALGTAGVMAMLEKARAKKAKEKIAKSKVSLVKRSRADYEH